jgi:hypothetical protein
MKKTVLLSISLFFVISGAQAQNYYSTHSGSNGFLTVEQENAQMERVLAERRREERIESGEAAPAKTNKTTDTVAKKPAAQKNVWVKTKK